MKLFGKLTEFFRLSFRNNGNEVSIEPSSSTASTTNTSFELPPADGGTHQLLDTDTPQTISNKVLDASTVTTSGTFTHGATVDNPTSNVHGVTGNVVGTSDVQTLTSKTLDGNSNTLSLIHI